MDIELLTIFMFGALVLLLVLGLPFAFATGGTAVIFLIYLWGPPALMLIVMRVWDLMGSFILVAVPMFIFMGAVLERSGIAAALYEAIYQWMGRLRGGLAMATVVVCAILAAMVGIVGAGVVTMGIIALPEMLKRRYHKGMPLGSICAGGALGYLIPPSILFIFYAMAAGVSVGALFAGGFLPGLLLVVLYIVYIGIRGYFQPDMAPAVPKKEILPLKRRLILLKGVILPVLLICVVLGSIFTGIATPTEASGIGAMGALICAAVRRRLTWGMLKEVSYLTTGLTCMFMWVVFGASAFVGVYTLAGGARFLEEVILGLPLCPWGILIAMQIVLLILGMFVDWSGILMLTMPIFVPIIVELGFCPIWFGILFCINMQIAVLSPPFGLTLFYLKGVAPPEITMGDIYRSVWPFIGIQLLVLALVMIFPQIAMWLPNLLL